MKKGLIGRLEAVNIMVRPDISEQYGVRSVPWIRIGDFELEGLHSPAELRQWAERASSAEGLGEYYADLFKTGQLAKALASIEKHPAHFSALLKLAEDPDTELTVRIGVSAVIEDHAGSELLERHIPAFIDLSRHEDPRVRSDACHFLALTRNEAALVPLRELLDDPQAAVRDVAEDSLDELDGFLGS